MEKIFGYTREEILEFLDKRVDETDSNSVLDIDGKDFYTLLLEGSDILLDEHKDELRKIYLSCTSRGI